MKSLSHDCRERQAAHDRIQKEVEDWLRDNHQIEVIPMGVTTQTRFDDNNRFFQERD